MMPKPCNGVLGCFLGENTPWSLGREQGRITIAEPRLDQTKTDGRGDLAQLGLDC